MSHIQFCRIVERALFMAVDFWKPKPPCLQTVDQLTKCTLGLETTDVIQRIQLIANRRRKRSFTACIVKIGIKSLIVRKWIYLPLRMFYSSKLIISFALSQ
jgi:hypothetical protein